jgi:hypothetical protein
MERSSRKADAKMRQADMTTRNDDLEAQIAAINAEMAAVIERAAVGLDRLYWSHRSELRRRLRDAGASEDRIEYELARQRAMYVADRAKMLADICASELKED